MKHLFSTLALICTLSYSTTACVGEFTFSIQDNVVMFNGMSDTPGVTYFWDFGDGTVGTGQNPTHTYAVYPEHYSVLLTINNTSGCHDDYVNLINIQSGPGSNCEGSFTYVVENNVVAFTGHSSYEEVQYYWFFGDGSNAATGQNQTHTYDNVTETYEVCLIVVNGNVGCQDTICQPVHIESTPACEASFTYTINNNTVTFESGPTQPNEYYHWTFGDGSDGAGTNVTHTYDLYPEHYNVCAIFLNTITGCSDTVCQNIYIQNGPPECEASFTYTITGTEVHFHGESNVPGVTYNWNFGDQSDANGENVVHNYDLSPEHYTVCLIITNTSGCEAYICDTIFIESTTPEECHASFTYSISGNEVHFDGASNIPGVYYYWSFGDGTTGGGENPVHNYTLSPEHYNVCLTVYNSEGCHNTYCQTIFVEGNPNTSDCEASFTYFMDGNTVAFHGSSSVPGVDYTWSFGDGTEGFGENNVHTFINYPEHYIVCLTIHNSSGCESHYCQTIYVQSSGGSGSECEASFTYEVTDNTVHFSGHSNQDNVDFGWSFGDGSTGTGQNPTHTYEHFPEHYNVCLYIWNNATGCHDTICQTVYVQHGAPATCSAEFTYTITGNEVHFHGPSNADGTHYQWSFGDGHATDMHNPNHAYTLFPEHYEVCLTVSNTANGCSEESCQTIFIEEENGPDHFELSGTIYTGQNYADAGYVLLIQYDANTGMLIAVQTVGIGANGHYVFHAPAGNYFLKAALSPTSAVYDHFLPTYFEHELFWYNADVISLTSNLNRNIHMIEGNNPGGPGFIGGLVTEGANKTEGPGDPVADVQVMLLNMNDEPLQCTYSNAFGEFSFSNVAYGTYQVYGEVYNLTTIPAIVVVDGTTPSITNINLLVTSREVTIGVNEVAVINETSVGQVFPNPFKGDAAVNISLQKEARLSIRLFDIAGRQVYADIMNFGSGVQQINLPVAALSAGIYSLTLSDEKSNSMVTRKLVKTE